MEPEFSPITREETFQFACSPKVPCFNACCRNLNQFLTPYDIVCLKHHLGLSSEAFLSRYTVESVGPQSGLPIVSLKADACRGGACPFVTDQGCSVYPARPSSCRIYPLARAVRRCRKTGRQTEHFALLRESHCHGFEQPHSQRVDQWLVDQELGLYNRMNDGLLDIIALKNQFRPGPLDVESRRRFYLALYDLDGFRSRLGQMDFPQVSDAGLGLSGAIKNDDTALLAMAFRWIGQVLSGGKT